MSSLFLDHQFKLSFEKIAMPTKLTDSPESWQREIAGEVFKQIPFIADYAVNIVLDRVDAERGFAFGGAHVSNKSESPTPDQEGPSITIPIIVKERMLAPLDVFMDGEGVFPLTEDRVHERLFRTDTFETSTRKPTDRGIVDQLYPPMRTNYGMGSAMGDASGIGKTAGIPKGMLSATSPGAVARVKAHQMGASGGPISKYLHGHLSERAGMEATSHAEKLRNASREAGFPSAKIANDAMQMDMQRRAAVARTKSDAAAVDAMLRKHGSLIQAIAHTVPDVEADEFVNKVANDKGLSIAAARNQAFSKLAMEIASAPRVSIQKTAQALVQSIRPTVIQLEKLASGDFSVKWANAGAFMPQQDTVDADQASSLVGADMSGAQPGSVMTVSTEKAQKESLLEEGYKPVTEYGIYQVFDVNANQPLFGHVLPIIDFEQQPLELFVFSSPEAYAVQDEIAGVRQGDGELQTLPLEQAQGDGVLVFSVGAKKMALLPMTIQAPAQSPQGLQLIGETVFAEPVTLTVSPGLQGIVEMGEGEYGIPDFVEWLPLQNPTFLAKRPEEVESVGEAQRAPGTVNLGSTGQGEFSMEGQPVDKLAAEKRQFLKTAEAEFLLVGMGMDPFEARQAMAKAERGQSVKLAGLRQIVPLADLHAQAVKTAAKTLSQFPYHLRRDLVKEAAVLDDGDTTDKILAMNFLNPENISTFASYLPELDEASQKLAEMLLAVRLGMGQVDEGAIERAMKNLEAVISGLRALKQQDLV